MPRFYWRQHADIAERLIALELAGMRRQEIAAVLSSEFSIAITYKAVDQFIHNNPAWVAELKAALEGIVEPVREKTIEQKNRQIESLVREVQALRKAAEEQEDRIAVFERVVAQAIDTIPAAKKFIAPPKRREEPEVLCLNIGDWQVGQKFGPDLTLGLSEFNFEIATERVEKLYQKAVQLTGMYREEVDCPTLLLNVGGDMVEGEGIFANQAYHLDRGATDQAIQGGLLLARFVSSLAPHFETIRVRAVCGNHGRLAKDANTYSQHDWSLYWTAAQACREIEAIEWRATRGPAMAYRVSGIEKFNHLLIHGDEVPSSLSIPYYGLDRAVGQYVQLLQVPIHFMHVFHFHRPAKISIGFGEEIISGSLVGTSPYSVKRMRTGSRATQSLFSIHPHLGKVMERGIYLDDIPELEPDADGLYTPAESLKYELEPFALSSQNERST